MQDRDREKFETNGKLAVQVSYTIDTKRGPVRKTQETTVDKLWAILFRLDKRDAYCVETRTELPRSA